MDKGEFKGLKARSYNRKSSEQEERQALSIESQKAETDKLAISYGFELQESEKLTEAKSAKKSGQRPVFEQMVKDINKGSVQAIITWHPDRLSRNAGDAGRLVDLLDEEKLKYIITKQQIFRNTPSDKFFFTMLCSQAKMENDNKGENVKRGLVKKRQMGYPPGIAKIGYANDRGEKGFRKTLIDPERFEIVKKLFQMFLTEKYSVRELHRVAVNDFMLHSVARKKFGGKPLKLSLTYKMLSDPFYAGFFFGKDSDGNTVRYEVNPLVPRMITEREHYKILKLIRRRGNPRSSTHREEFPYKNFLKCGHCGGSVTAEKKLQIMCGNCKNKFAVSNKSACPKCGSGLRSIKNKVLNYIYYHCTKKKVPDCPAKSFSESVLGEQVVDDYIRTIALSPPLARWCIDNIEILEHKQKTTDKTIENSWHQDMKRLEEQHGRLLDAYTRGFTDEEGFREKELEIKGEMANVRARMGVGQDFKLDMRDVTNKLEILTELEEVIKSGDFEEITEALSSLGSNLTLTEKKVIITKGILYKTIEKGLLEAKTKNPQFEPKNILDTSGRNAVFEDVCPSLLPRQGSNLRPID